MSPKSDLEGGKIVGQLEMLKSKHSHTSHVLSAWGALMLFGCLETANA